MDKSKFKTPYVTLKENNDIIKENDDSFIIKGKAKGGIDRVHMRADNTSKLTINLKINHVVRR